MYVWVCLLATRSSDYKKSKWEGKLLLYTLTLRYGPVTEVALPSGVPFQHGILFPPMFNPPCPCWLLKLENFLCTPIFNQKAHFNSNYFLSFFAPLSKCILLLNVFPLRPCPTAQFPSHGLVVPCCIGTADSSATRRILSTANQTPTD